MNKSYTPNINLARNADPYIIRPTNTKSFIKCAIEVTMRLFLYSTYHAKRMECKIIDEERRILKGG